MLVEVPDTGPLRSRAETLVRMRSRICEEVGNVLKAAALQEPFSPTLARWLAARAHGVARATSSGSSPRSSTPLPDDVRAARLAVVDALASHRRVGSVAPISDLDVPAARKATVDAIISCYWSESESDDDVGRDMR